MHRSSSRRTSVRQLLWLIVLIQMGLAAQENITIGKYRTLESKILEGEVSYLEHLPGGYGETDKTYPVLLLMNAQNPSTFANAVATIVPFVQRENS